MLAQSAQQMGAEVHILSPKADDPAAQVTGFHHLGNPDKPEDLRAFLKQVDVLTFESEFFDMTSVRESAPAALSIFPSPELMRELQDRRTQKALLEKHKIPTAAFMAVTTAGDLAAAWSKFPQGFVLKKARGGYDGFGTFYSRHEADLDLLARDFPGASIAESFVRFKRVDAFVCP
jgi:5-(carboxyamino)imidazole ribonucleotide synthase